MNKTKILGALVAAMMISPAIAGPVNTTGNLTSEVIFGDGNANGSFTGVNQNNVELALRGKVRYNTDTNIDGVGNPENTFNYDGDKTYTFLPSQSNAPADRSAFNFEWSINSNVSGATDGTWVLNDLTYFLEIDYDPTIGTDFVSFDPINQPIADHAFGTNSTANGEGTQVSATNSYASLISHNNVAQNSWNLGFFEPMGFDPQTQGIFTMNLSAFLNGALQASTSIDIIYGEIPASVVSTPSTLLFMFAGLFGLGVAAKRRNTQL